MTTLDLGNIRINWRGPYQPDIHYVKDDAVCYQGSSFIATGAVSGIAPVVGDYWDLLAAGSDQLTRRGDLLIHDGNTPIALARGQPAQILQMINELPAWRDSALPPGSRVGKLATVNGMGSWNTRVYLMADGTLKACGYGGNFANGDPLGESLHLPSRVATEDPDVRFVEVFSGGMQHYGLTQQGDVWSWGYNHYGQLGHGDTINRAVAKRINFFVEQQIAIARIIPGRPNYYDQGCAYFLTTQGCVYACGINSNGNMGNGTSADQYTPVRCGSLEHIVDLAVSGLPHSIYAIEANGNLWVWGYNAQGQLGLGDNTTRHTPILHPSLHPVSQAVTACGYQVDGAKPAGYALVLGEGGTLWSTGYNEHGQLGLGDTSARNSFSQIPHRSVFKRIIAGDGRYGSAGAISDQGELYLWGYNYYGQLGMGHQEAQLTPVKPEGAFQGEVVKACFGGGASYEGCIVHSGNSLWAAGYSAYGNIGIGSTEAVNPGFRRVLGQSGVIDQWGCFGQGTKEWGLGVRYDDGRVDACGKNSNYGQTGTQTGTLHDVSVLKNVIF